MNIKELLISSALDCGADKAAIISTDAIVLSTEFRDICVKNQCGRYNRCWQCPPDCGDIEELMDKVRAFPCAMIFQSISTIEDSFDIEGMQEAAANHSALCQKIRAAVGEILKNEFFCVGSGGCHLCDECTKIINEPCRHPEIAMTSMESCGIDVYNTVKPTDLKYINGQNTVTYFGAVMFTE